jgi:hypothetical protein
MTTKNKIKRKKKKETSLSLTKDVKREREIRVGFCFVPYLPLLYIRGRGT